MKLKAPRETTQEAWAWDDALTLEFGNSRPAVCGIEITKIDVPTVAGKTLSVKVPAGTSTGNRLRLRGFGAAGGDQYLEFEVMVPPHPDERSRELIEEFAQRNPQQPRRGAPWE